MRITKVYTRGGDKGKTSLVMGPRVRKDHPRVEAFGTIDELNAAIGLARTWNQRATEAAADRILRIDQMLHRVQNELFNLGSELATLPQNRWEGMPLVQADDVTRLETWIDEMNEDLPPLKEFILPGGGPVGAFLHQARTICRRAERQLVHIADEQGITPLPLAYLNRLSDFLFVLGRWAAQALGEVEYAWENPSRRRKDA